MFIMNLCIQVHWQLRINNSCVWLVNILLRKFDTSSKKELKMINKQILWWKTTKNAKKVDASIKQHSLFWTRLTDPWCKMLQTLQRIRNTNTLFLTSWRIAISLDHVLIKFEKIIAKRSDVWKLSKCGVFSGLNAGKYGPGKTLYLDTFHAVRSNCLFSFFYNR